MTNDADLENQAISDKWFTRFNNNAHDFLKVIYDYQSIVDASPTYSDLISEYRIVQDCFLELETIVEELSDELKGQTDDKN